MGGRVFQETSPIKKENIRPTLRKFLGELGTIFPGTREYLKKVVTLGSTLKKDESGDIDLGIPGEVLLDPKNWNISEESVNRYFEQFKRRARTASNNQIRKKSTICAIADEIKARNTNMSVDEKSAGNGVLFFEYPQFSEKEQLDLGVQIDLNFGDVDWLQFAYHSAAYSGNIKGLHRTQLMLCLFLIKGYVFSHNFGVKNKETNKVVATTPKQAIELLRKLYEIPFTEDVLSDYYKLQKFLKENLDEDTLHKIWDRYLVILDKTRCDIPLDMNDYWLDEQGKLNLTGKFLPATSLLYPFREIE